MASGGRPYLWWSVAYISWISLFRVVAHPVRKPTPLQGSVGREDLAGVHDHNGIPPGCAGAHAVSECHTRPGLFTLYPERIVALAREHCHCGDRAHQFDHCGVARAEAVVFSELPAG